MRKMKLFGKSLTISMLKHYYDILQKDNFVSLLYYFGMVSIDGTYKGNTKLSMSILMRHI